MFTPPLSTTIQQWRTEMRGSGMVMSQPASRPTRNRPGFSGMVLLGRVAGDRTISRVHMGGKIVAQPSGAADAGGNRLAQGGFGAEEEGSPARPRRRRVEDFAREQGISRLGQQNQGAIAFRTLAFVHGDGEGRLMRRQEGRRQGQGLRARPGKM